LLKLQTRHFEGHAMHVYENSSIILGFSEISFSAAVLQRFFKPRPLMFLKQVHSATIIRGSDWQAVSEGDGLLLQKPGAVAVIQTADCLPLFYFADDFTTGGVIHVGWRGLWLGIEKKLLEMLPGGPDNYFFFMGPGIEKKCYPVGDELLQLFANKPYADSVFTPWTEGKHLLDIKKGLFMSLRAAGIAAERIQDCGICTFCSENHFPSFRRDGATGKRIFNFLSLL